MTHLGSFSLDGVTLGLHPEDRRTAGQVASNTDHLQTRPFETASLSVLKYLSVSLTTRGRNGHKAMSAAAM